MTKVQRTYSLTKPLNDVLMKSISDAHGIYGFQKIQLTPALNAIKVEWDASRLSAHNMERALQAVGIPIETR